MAASADKPLFTDVFRLDNFIPSQGSAYVFGTSVEDRSAHSAEWEARSVDVNFVRITENGDNAILIEHSGCSFNASLRSSQQLDTVWHGIAERPIYLDITGLSHHVWAPLLKASLGLGINVRVVYVEPGDYRTSGRPTESEIFDLSERIRGIAPIPGFVSFSEADEGNVCFVPLLGFEGTRLAYLLEQVQPPGGKIIPVVGVPGFRLEYPFFAFHGNRVPLIQHGAWRSVRFAIANCAFSLFYVLEEIAARYPRDLVKIAPIGTKPHALGAVLFSLAAGRPVELVYDHPIRKSTRTQGAARLLVYHVASFLVGRTSA